MNVNHDIPSINVNLHSDHVDEGNHASVSQSLGRKGHTDSDQNFAQIDLDSSLGHKDSLLESEVVAVKFAREIRNFKVNRVGGGVRVKFNITGSFVQNERVSNHVVFAVVEVNVRQINFAYQTHYFVKVHIFCLFDNAKIKGIFKASFERSLLSKRTKSEK